MGLESVPVRFLLGDGTPGQLSCPNSVTLLPQSPLTEAEHSALTGGTTNMLGVTGLQTLPGTNGSKLFCFCVIPEMRDEGSTGQKQPVPQAT